MNMLQMVTLLISSWYEIGLNLITAKFAYGLDNIKAKLKQTSQSWVASIALVINVVAMTRQALVSLILT